MAEKKWFVYYTRSRWEKKTFELLKRKGYDVFLPLHKEMRQWSDRKKKVEVPLFNSYIFVNTVESEIYQVLQTPGIVKNIKHSGSPAILHEREYDQIKFWLDTGLPLEVEGDMINVKIGERVEISAGNFRGEEGEVYRLDENTCVVLIESINQVLKIDIQRELLSVIA